MKRSEVAKNRIWKVEDIFDSIKQWEESYAQTEAKIDFSKYEGKLSDKKIFKECYDALYAVYSEISCILFL